MKKSSLFQLTTLVMVSGAVTSHAATIYSDSFTAANATSLEGRAPDTNNGVTGATWEAPTTVWPTDIQGNRARLGADVHVSIDVASAGSYVQSEIIRLSATIDIGTTGGPTTSLNTGAQRGVGLGYYTSVGSVATNENFRGLLLGTDGRLIVAQANVAGSPRFGYVAEIATGIDTGVSHTLSYDINTTSGDISNILLDGATQTDVTTTFFNADVNRAGVGASSNAGGTSAFFDDFTVTSIPEPSSLMLLGMIGSTAFLRRRRA